MIQVLNQLHSPDDMLVYANLQTVVTRQILYVPKLHRITDNTVQLSWLWHCQLSTRKDMWPVKTCSNYIKGFHSATPVQPVVSLPKTWWDRQAKQSTQIICPPFLGLWLALGLTCIYSLLHLSYRNNGYSTTTPLQILPHSYFNRQVAQLSQRDCATP